LTLVLGFIGAPFAVYCVQSTAAHVGGGAGVGVVVVVVVVVVGPVHVVRSMTAALTGQLSLNPVDNMVGL
jgi:hypothetical protein